MKNDKQQRQGPNWIDRVVGHFSPGRGLRRVLQREMLSRAYEGASRRDGWRPSRAGASANADHRADARELRHRARALVQNVPYIAQAVRAVVAAKVGVGIVPVWKDAATAQRWKKWVSHADFDGLLDFYGLQAKAEMARDVDGAVLVRRHVRKLGPGVVPLQLQVIEIDFLDMDLSRVLDGGEIISGIEYDRRGRRVAYWLFDRHPGDVGVWTLGRSGSSKRVPAAEIIHLFASSRPGQQDGISRLAPIIGTVRDLQVYMDAEMQRKNLETRLGVLAEWSPNDAPPALPGAGGGDVNASPATMDLGELAGGGIVGLPPGMSNPVFIEPKAVPGYVEYVKQRLKEAASGYGCPYELMTGDMTEVNFSSSRVRTNQFRREVEVEQWHVLIPMFCAPVARWFVEAQSLIGSVVDDQAPDWTTPKWASPNPVQDVASDVSAVKGGLMSLSETIRQRGYDPDVMFAELEADLKRLNAAGILPLLAALMGANNPLELIAQVGEKDAR